jgi:hypothetical protein
MWGKVYGGETIDCMFGSACAGSNADFIAGCEARWVRRHWPLCTRSFSKPIECARTGMRRVGECA